MQYALLLYLAPEARPEAQAETDAEAQAVRAKAFEEWIAYTRALKSAGALIAVQRLQPVETATTMRVRDGERLLTDGPFIETKEQLLGFYLIEAPDLDAALDWAVRMPHARYGTTEIRPVVQTPLLTQIAQE